MAAHALRRWLQFPGAARPRARRALGFGLLLAAVAAGHHGALQGLAAWLQRPAAAPAPTAVPPAALRVRLLAPPADLATATADAEPAPVRRPAPALPRPTVPPTRRLARAPSPVSPPAAEAAPAAPAEPPPPLADDGAATVPPRYPTRPAPSRTLHFTLQRGTQQGEGEWRWQHDGQHFESHLQATLAGRVLLEQHSQGGFDEAGLAPARQTERGRGRSAQAVNFQRDKGLLSFSGSARSWALWPATQDRLSWLPQLLAVLAARGGWAEGDTLRLAVAGADGELALWTWQLADRSPWAGQAALHWVREPPRPYDHRIELWLEPAAPHWPLGWRWQRVPGGEAVTWTRSDAADP